MASLPARVTNALVPARVLVIDDNRDLADNLKDILEGARELDVEAVCAPDGASGLALARQASFDVAIVDVKLPDGSGVDLIRSLRKSSKFGEIVLITGFATVDSAIAALRAGAFAFLLKSSRPEEVISTIEQALAKVALQREREELERRYRALVEAADVLIVGLDKEGKIVLFNPKIAAIVGTLPSDAEGQSFADSYVACDEIEGFVRACAEARVSDKATEIEVGILDEAGIVRRVRWHLSFVRDSRGSSDLVYGIGIDVTERRMLEKRAADAEALSAMGSLALGLAHEIRNPLNAAVLQLHLLGRGTDKHPDEGLRAKMRNRVTIIEQEIGRLERMLTEFLELARPRGIRRLPVDVGKMLREVLEFQAGAFSMHRIELVADIAEDCLASVDPEKLRQVVINLVVNALEVMPESGKLTVRVLGAGENISIEIIDSGPGIDPSILPSIFDPFFTTKEAGTGLGLSIVRKIIDQHGGTIGMDSVLGEGTRVKIELPRIANGPIREEKT